MKSINEVDLLPKFTLMKCVTAFTLLIFAFSFLHTFAQQNHFIYFQTENKQPFYIKLDNKIFSSSSSGYLILSKLTAGNYTIKFGSPKNEWPEQSVNYKLYKDAGFVFKNMGENGWGLYNLQSSEMLMAERALPTNTVAQETRDDDFSKMLANVVNDSTIKEKDVDVKDEVEQVKKEDVVVEMPQASPESTVVPAKNSIIKRNLKIKNKDGVELVYIDEYDNKKDTVRIFVPAEKLFEKNIKTSTETLTQIDKEIDSSKTVNETGDDKIKDQKDTVANTVVQSGNPPAVADHPTNNEKSDTVTQAPVTSDESIEKIKPDETKSKDTLELLPPNSGMINIDCKDFAIESDFLKLRRKMVSEKNEENMIEVARKAFKTKCFTTEYIKNLSALFLKDRSKYNFFDAAYPFVSDTGMFSTLENQLIDPYYIKRFKAMIHQ